MDLFLFFLISILLLIAYISATKKYVRLPNKKTKKNMDIYYHKLNKNKKSAKYLGWALVIFICFGLLQIPESDIPCKKYSRISSC